VKIHWGTIYVARLGDGQYGECRLTVTQTDEGFEWEGDDPMAWKSKECHGSGVEPTLGQAQAAAEYWFTTGRFL
jgi:hypothetical protein